jgi:hypothetical protein
MQGISLSSFRDPRVQESKNIIGRRLTLLGLGNGRLLIQGTCKTFNLGFQFCDAVPLKSTNGWLAVNAEA